jgi:hypothetical protein
MNNNLYNIRMPLSEFIVALGTNVGINSGYTPSGIMLDVNDIVMDKLVEFCDMTVEKWIAHELRTQGHERLMSLWARCGPASWFPMIAIHMRDYNVIHGFNAMNVPGVTAAQRYGRFYGYPECCIQYYHDRKAIPHTERTDTEYFGKHINVLVCPACAKRNVESYVAELSQRRICSIPFYDNNEREAKRKYQAQVRLEYMIAVRRNLLDTPR